MRKKKGYKKEEESTKADLTLWMPRTQLGHKVKNGEIKTMQDLIKLSAPIKEVEIIDKLLPELSEEIINVGRVQRVTDSGRRMRFRVVMAVGNNNGYVGVGEATGKEAGPTIRKSIERAKLNIKEVKRGCGSWECGCRTPHSVPFKVAGSLGSVRVELSPAPKGTGLVSGEIAKKILTLAGIKDVWVHTQGHTRTSINFAHAVVDALVNTNTMKIGDSVTDSLGIVEGASITQEDGKAGEEKQSQEA
ncbi:MAG: 30S ribosomal protein S5 [Candidatus Altiarchaeota archaeon]|nr:30S ribosomal protein S5 [Candidatus Altiarchaeota archaeon]